MRIQPFSFVFAKAQPLLYPFLRICPPIAVHPVVGIASPPRSWRCGKGIVCSTLVAEPFPGWVPRGKGALGPARRLLSGIFRYIRIVRMLPSVSAPCFYGKDASFSNYAQPVDMLGQVANFGPAKRAPALILHMDAAARRVCMAAGSDVITDHDWGKEDFGDYA